MSEIVQITTGTGYLNGVSMLGMVENFNTPEVVAKMAEYQAAGLIGSFELPTGIDKMEASMKFKSIFPKPFVELLNIFKRHEIQIRSPREIFEDGSLARTENVTVFMTVTTKKAPTKADIGNNKRTEHETTFNVLAYKLVVDGRVLIEVNVLRNIYTVDGVDLLADWRAAQGQ